MRKLANKIKTTLRKIILKILFVQNNKELRPTMLQTNYEKSYLLIFRTREQRKAFRLYCEGKDSNMREALLDYVDLMLNSKEKGGE